MAAVLMNRRRFHCAIAVSLSWCESCRLLDRRALEPTSHDVEELVGPPGIRREHPHDAAVVTDDGGRQRMRDEARSQPGIRRRRTGRHLRSARRCPSPASTGRIDWRPSAPIRRTRAARRACRSRIEGHAEQRQPAAHTFVVRAPPHALEVLDHQRTEVGQRAARIDEGDDEDSSGELAQRERPAVLIEQAESRARPLPAPPCLPTARLPAAATPAAVIFTSSSQLGCRSRPASRRCGRPRAAAVRRHDLERHAHRRHQPFTASCATTTRDDETSWPVTVPVSWNRRTVPPFREHPAIGRTRRTASAAAGTLRRRFLKGRVPRRREVVRKRRASRRRRRHRERPTGSPILTSLPQHLQPELQLPRSVGLARDHPE